MFSDESNKLETYTYVRTKYILLKKDINLLVDLLILKFMYREVSRIYKITVDRQHLHAVIRTN